MSKNPATPPPVEPTDSPPAMSREELIAAWEQKAFECERLQAELNAANAANAELQATAARHASAFDALTAEFNELKAAYDKLTIEPAAAAASPDNVLPADPDIDACARLKRELHEALTTYRGVLRFLLDPANSSSEKLALLQRELAKP